MKQLPKGYILVQHKPCSTMWTITKNSYNLLYCPSCKSSKDFVILEE